MQPFLQSDVPVPKADVVHTTLPHFIDPAQIPVKLRPFSSIRKLQCACHLDVVIPCASMPRFQQRLAALAAERAGLLTYGQLKAPASFLLANPFFTTFVKSPTKSPTMIISKGRPGVDTRIALHAGILTLEMDKATYERAGLVGVAIPDGGKKHQKSRWKVEIDLRVPSMLHGKRGFERVKWALRETQGLKEERGWSICAEHWGAEEEENGLLKELQIDWIHVVGADAQLQGVRIPEVLARSAHESPRLNEEEMADMFEWISMLMLGSDRVRLLDRTDPYLCRYAMPALGETREAETADLTRRRWTGLLPLEHTARVLIAAIKAAEASWAALQITGIEGATVTLLVLDGKEVLEWAVCS